MAKRIIIIIVIVLLLVNTAVLGLLWFNKKPGGQQPGRNAREFIKKELVLNTEQLKQYKTMREAHFEAMHEINADTRELKEQMFDLISAPALDSTKLNNLLQQIGSKETQKDKITVERFRQLRSILDDQQKQKFDKIIRDVLRMLGRPQPPQMRRNGGPGVRIPGAQPPGQPPPEEDMPPPHE
jgi:Spy/CpxP family protein refolding chaperone